MTNQPKMGAMIPIVSVVLPVFNAEKYVKEAVHSILDQTFRNFELVIINDGSTDGTLRILEHFKKLDERVILVSRENRGLVETLNEGISIARGQWIARMDADDIALPNRFERQLEWLGKTGADICGSWVQRFGTMDKRVVRLRQTDEAIKIEMLFCSPFAHPTVMMRTAMVKQLCYSKEWEKAEDYDLWERAAEAGWKMTNVPEVLLLYRVHESQISKTTLSIQRQLTQQIQLRYWIFIFGVLQLDKSWIAELLNIYDPSILKLNMDAVDAALAALLRQAEGHDEMQNVVLAHAMRLYYQVAANCPDIVSRWINLNRSTNRHASSSSTLRLWLLHYLRIRPKSKIFIALRSLYVALGREV